MKLHKRILLIVLSCLCMASMTLHAAKKPQPTFLQRTKNSLTKFIKRMPRSIKWEAACITATLFFYLANKKGRFFGPTYQELIQTDRYANTVLPALGRNFEPVTVHTARGDVRLEQFDVARQNLYMGMCTCGQHALTQANIILQGLENNQLEAARFNLQDHHFMGLAVQQTCHEAQTLQNQFPGLLDWAVEQTAGWTESELLNRMLERENGSYFVGNRISRTISPRSAEPHPAIAMLNTAGHHRVLLNIGAHWITVVIDRPRANGIGRYLVANSSGCDVRNNQLVRDLIDVLEGAPAVAASN